MASSKSILGYYQNVRGLRTKTHEFLSEVSRADYDFLFVTESWLTSDFYDRELFDSRYTIFRCDRSWAESGAERGGGAMIAIRNELQPLLRNWPGPSLASSEYVWISIPLCGKSEKYLNMACVYIPHGPGYRTALNDFFDTTSDIINDHPNDLFLIVGDFNVSDAVWTGCDLSWNKLLDGGGNHAVVSLRDFLDFTGLNQSNGILNEKGRILDLVMSNFDCETLAAIKPLVPEDAHHRALELSLTIELTQPVNSTPLYAFNFPVADFNSINLELNKIDWGALFASSDVETCTKSFYDILNDLINKYVPRKLVRSSRSSPLWHNRPLKKLLNEKKNYHKKWKLYKNPLDYESFKLLRKRAKAMEIQCFKDYIRYAEQKIKSHPKFFWSYIKTIKTSKGMPQTMIYRGIPTTDEQRICDLFSEHFYSVFETPKENSILHLKSDENAIIDICSIAITVDLVHKELNSVDLTKGAGPDGVHPLLIKKCSGALTNPITLIFKKSLSEGCFPALWKKAWITPIPKGSLTQDIVKYRPISKLCQFGKILEKIVTAKLFNTVRRFLSPSQHGFCRGRGVESNLLTFTEIVLEAMDRNLQVDAIYTDFAKAFDKICHNTLLSKLFQLGIRGDLFRWITSYVRNRSQAVVLSGLCSQYKDIPSGVPQGSHLGPLLFTLYVNDLSDSITNSRILMYADDAKIFRVIHDINDSVLLQQDLDRFVNYCNSSNLFLNTDKCFTITYTRKRNPINSNYKLCGKVLSKVNEIRDLGVVLDAKLTYIPHIENILSKAFKFLGFILRVGKPFNSAFTYKVLYNSYVRSRLEFASSVWNPYQKVHIEKIERLQKKFIKSLEYRLGNAHIDYENSLKSHKLFSLSQRRDCNDAMFLFKILNDIVDAPWLLSSISFRIPRRQERNVRKKNLFVVSKSKTCYTKNSFIRRSCNLYNNKLSDVEVFCTNKNKFRRDVLRVLSN